MECFLFVASRGFIARAIIINKDRNKILLVKNKNGDFWYPPGGNWEPKKESIENCAIREVKEETGLAVKLLKFMYAQEFRNKKRNKAMIELFWLCEAEEGEMQKHIDREIKEELCLDVKKKKQWH